MTEKPDSPLRKWRKAQNWTLETAADAFGLKSKGQLSEIESGEKRASVPIALSIERATSGAIPAHDLNPEIALVRAATPERAAA